MCALDVALPRTSPPWLSRQGGFLIAFWLLTYSIFTVRGRLLPDDALAWLSPKRLLAITLGTFFLWLAMSLQDRVSSRAPSFRVSAALLTSAAAAVGLLVVRSLFDDLISGADPSSLADETRWLLIWLGYFLAWLSLHLAFSNNRRAERILASVEEVSHPAVSATAAEPENVIWLHRNQQRIRVAVESIEWAEAEGNYVRIYGSDGAGLLRASLSQLEMHLGKGRFVRTHRSAICRRTSIVAIERQSTGAYVALLASGARVPVGRRIGQEILSELRMTGSPRSGTPPSRDIHPCRMTPVA